MEPITIEFKIETTNDSKQSMLNTVVLLLRDLKEINTEDFGCYEDYVKYNNNKVRQIQNELSLLFVDY